MKVLTDMAEGAKRVAGLYYDALTNNGVVGLPTKDKQFVQFDFKDLFEINRLAGKLDIGSEDTMSTPDLTRFFGESITRVVSEAIEPELLVVPNLFTEIRYDGPSRSLEIGSLGAFHAAEVPEGGEYEEVDFNFGEGDMVHLTISKHGLKLRVTDEVIEDSLFDVFGLWLRLAGRALARHKEDSAIKLLNEFGYTVFDNAVPSASEQGVTTGRDIAGAQNGTMSVEDIFEMYTWMYLRGFVPDTMLINPLAWRVFMTDPETREIIFKGATLVTKRMPNGSGPGWATGHGGLGLRLGNTGAGYDDPKALAGPNPFVSNLNPIGATWNIEPRYLPSPLKVIVSPYVSYTPAATSPAKPITDVIMADSSRAGVLLSKDGVSTEDWDDPERDIKNLKVKERWGMGLFEQGKGVAIARNVVIDRNFTFENFNNQQLAALNLTSPTVTP